MDRRDDGVGFRGENSIELVMALDRRALQAAYAALGRPKAGKRKQRPILAERKPHRRLARLGVGVFAKRCRRDDAATILAQPSPPVRAHHIADVGDRLAAELRRPRHAPARCDKARARRRA